MAMNIAILEDNEDRKTAMRASLREKFHQYEVQCFDSASEMIDFLSEHLTNTIVISLDHDLELKENGAGRAIDVGTGREVADFLAGHTPVCPVVIHSTNSPAALGMETVLRESAWKTSRVIPFDDTAWIPTEWLKTIRRAILGTARVPDKKAR